MKYHQGEGFSVVDFELSEVHRILGYVLWAGNDAPSRDPISWVVMGKKTKNDKQWFFFFFSLNRDHEQDHFFPLTSFPRSLLDVRSNVRSPDRFQIYSFFPLNYGDWEKEEKDDWGLMPPIQGGGYLNALDVSLYDSKVYILFSEIFFVYLTKLYNQQTKTKPKNNYIYSSRTLFDIGNAPPPPFLNTNKYHRLSLSTNNGCPSLLSLLVSLLFLPS